MLKLIKKTINKCFFLSSKKLIIRFQLYLGNLTSQDENIRCKQRHLATVSDNHRSLFTESQGPDNKHLFLASFLQRAIKSFSFATHLFRGIIIIIRKSLRGELYYSNLNRNPLSQSQFGGALFVGTLSQTKYWNDHCMQETAGL